MSKQLWGYKVPFKEHEVNSVYVPRDRYFEKQDIISVMEFLQDTKFPKEAIEDVNFWKALRTVVRPIFKGSSIVAVVLNLDDKIDTKSEMEKNLGS